MVGQLKMAQAVYPEIKRSTTALYLSKITNPRAVSATQIATGLPMGGDLEYTDAVTPGKALEERREI